MWNHQRFKTWTDKIWKKSWNRRFWALVLLGSVLSLGWLTVTQPFLAPSRAESVAPISEPAVTSSPNSAIIRYPIPGSSFPISRAVELPADAQLVYVSGQVPPVVNAEADRVSIAAFGDTAQQTVGVLERIEIALTDIGLTLEDVVKMQGFLVGDPDNEGRMDFAGFMNGYTQFFGTAEQPNLPARSVMQVAGLANPGWLVEIEVVAVRSP